MCSPIWTYYGCLFLNETEEASNAQIEWYHCKERTQLPSPQEWAKLAEKRPRRRSSAKGGITFLARNVRKTVALLKKRRVDLSAPQRGAVFSDRWQEHSASWWSEPWSPPASAKREPYVTPTNARSEFEVHSPPALAIPSEVLQVSNPFTFSAAEPTLAEIGEQMDIGTAMELLLDELNTEEDAPENDFLEKGTAKAVKKRKREQAAQPAVKKKRRTRSTDNSVGKEFDEKRAERAWVLQKHRKQSSRPAAANNRHRVHRKRRVSEK